MLASSINSNQVLLVIAIAIVVLPIIPTWIAVGKGRSAFGFYLFGLCFFLPALITALIISPLEPKKNARARPGDAWVSNPPRSQASPSPLPSTHAQDPISQLERFEALLSRGAITKEEFDQQKARILGAG